MAMFSDFSLKALVGKWDAHQLGPNPFIRVGQHTGLFEIMFEQETLKNCPSAQLQAIGEMAEGGKCNVMAAGGTITYTVNGEVKSDFYDLTVLTVTPTINAGGHKCKIGNTEGAAGHVLLKYKTGGHLLTSMGHWIELMKSDTSEKKLFEVAEKTYGVNKAA